MTGSDRALKDTGELKFFADSMLGKLATWMRMLGLDVEYERRIEDSDLVYRAIKEGRIILTRDTLLTKRKSVRGRYFFVRSPRFKDQLREVSIKFKIGLESAFTRCLRCNLPLVDISRDTVQDKVPPYVFNTQERFSRCPKCSRIYWAGTHRNNMLNELSAIVKDV